MNMQPCRLPCAVACVSGGRAEPQLKGIVRFSQHCGGVLVSAEVTGLPRDGFYAFHIHEGNNCKGENFDESGSHYNPTGNTHPDHAGDLPPLLSCQGKAKMSVLTGRFRVDEIIGKTVIIHSNRDDFHSQPSGNPGEKIACGIICRVTHKKA
jgi:Cu-Zn family superoxide dismutase